MQPCSVNYALGMEFPSEQEENDYYFGDWYKYFMNNFTVHHYRAIVKF